MYKPQNFGNNVLWTDHTKGELLVSNAQCHIGDNQTPNTTCHHDGGGAATGPGRPSSNWVDHDAKVFCPTAKAWTNLRHQQDGDPELSSKQTEKKNQGFAVHK